jgi:ribosome biogenesis GTPase
MQKELIHVEVLANFGFEVEVVDESKRQYRCLVKKSLARLVVGDKVQAQRHNEELELLKRLPRKNLLTRQVGKTRNTQLFIASNLDCIFIVCSPIPAMGNRFIDAIIIAAEQQKIKPILLLNKSDLEEFTVWQKEIYEYYQNTTLPFFSVSALNPDTLTDIKEEINGKKSLFIGASGVGKSTLLNTLIGKKYAKTQELSSHSQQGKHTTSNSICYQLDEITQIIDMPGIRTFNLGSYDNIEAGYPDLSGYWEKCQFRNCQHNQEPNCALQDAVKKGEIVEQRLLSYVDFKLLSEHSKGY